MCVNLHNCEGTDFENILLYVTAKRAVVAVATGVLGEKNDIRDPPRDDHSQRENGNHGNRYCRAKRAEFLRAPSLVFRQVPQDSTETTGDYETHEQRELRHGVLVARNVEICRADGRKYGG